MFALGVCHQFNHSLPIGHSFREGKLFRTQFTCRVSGKAKSASGNWTFFSLFSLLKVCTNRACKLTFPSPSRGNELSFSGGPQFLPDDHSSTGPLHSQAEDTLMNVNLPPPHRVLPVNFSDDKFPRSCMSHSLQRALVFFFFVNFLSKIYFILIAPQTFHPRGSHTAVSLQWGKLTSRIYPTWVGSLKGICTERREERERRRTIQEGGLHG